MNTVIVIFASIAILFHALAFVLESLLFMRPQVYRRFQSQNAEQAQAARLFAFNQGFYNLFLAASTVVGIVLAAGNDVGRDWALVAVCCTFMVGAALVLIVSERRMIRAAAIQGTAPLAALLLMAIG